MVGPTVWAEISLPRLRNNFRAIRQLIGPHVQVMAVVKANGYGHGAEDVARVLGAEGAEWFGVTCAAQGVRLRAAGVRRPVLLLGGFWPGEEEALLEQDLTPVVFTLDQLELLENLGRKRARRIPFHLKVDTGMGRLGLAAAEVPALIRALESCSHAEMQGLCTHFASADAPSLDSTREQAALFACVQKEFERHGIRPTHVHLANSAALARCPDARGTIVRPGLALYGYQQVPSPLAVEPVLTLKSRIISIRRMPGGSALGYGGAYVTPADAVIASVAAGYADGVNRGLSNRGRALVRGRAAPIVGRVSMELTALDVTGVPEARVGDEVVFIGRQGGQVIAADEVADCSSTICYEILCNIGARVHRLYVED